MTASFPVFSGTEKPPCDHPLPLHCFNPCTVHRRILFPLMPPSSTSGPSTTSTSPSSPTSRDPPPFSQSSTIANGFAINLNHGDITGYLPEELGLLTDLALFHINPLAGSSHRDPTGNLPSHLRCHPQPPSTASGRLPSSGRRSPLSIYFAGSPPHRKLHRESPFSGRPQLDPADARIRPIKLLQF